MASLDVVKERWLFGSPIPYAEPPWARGCPSPYFKDSHRRLRKAMREWVDTVRLLEGVNVKLPLNRRLKLVRI